ncbi:MAG: 1-acyl-sn-glycerol-3-phosphate acyltransferase [Hyphomicrobiales bacterium]|nr:1-acyl-sn-glycerol-3-phosphate acyltransferase [Hyphomicrobiales bacterium]
MQTLRGALLLIGFIALTLPLMPVQYALAKLGSAHARKLPFWYHRRVARLFGIRVQLTGAVASGAPVLLVSNHISWLDIIVLSSIAPVSFVAKSEIDGWPVINLFARLQRTVFVDRNKRISVRETAMEIAGRLETGDCLVLFAEGTSGDGNQVLPFKSSLFAAVSDFSDGASSASRTVVQTATIVYTRLNGLPLNRGQRPLIAWYGGMEILSHAWELLKLGPVDVSIRVSEPAPLQRFQGRKQIAAYTEILVRQNFTELLTARPQPVPVIAETEPRDDLT